MIVRGQKRKLEDMEPSERRDPTWERQRQFVFSVSMNKYQHGQELPEPSLRRSVLIANTLRQISLESCAAAAEDMEVSQSLQLRDESSFPAGGKPSLPASCPATSSNPVPDSVPVRSATCHSAESNVTVGDEEEDWGSADSDISLSAAISSVLIALDSTNDGAATRTPLRSLENLSGSSEGGVECVKQGTRGHAACWDQEMETRSGYLSDITVEDLFQDIDTSIIERDAGLLGLIGSGTPAGDDLLRYLPPFSSSTLKPNGRCLPSISSFSPASPPSTSTSFPGQNQHREGLELDHLMEILVES